MCWRCRSSEAGGERARVGRGPCGFGGGGGLRGACKRGEGARRGAPSLAVFARDTSSRRAARGPSLSELHTKTDFIFRYYCRRDHSVRRDRVAAARPRPARARRRRAAHAGTGGGSASPAPPGGSVAHRSPAARPGGRGRARTSGSGVGGAARAAGVARARRRCAQRCLGGSGASRPPPPPPASALCPPAGCCSARCAAARGPAPGGVSPHAASAGPRGVEDVVHRASQVEQHDRVVRGRHTHHRATAARWVCGGRHAIRLVLQTHRCERAESRLVLLLLLLLRDVDNC